MNVAETQTLCLIPKPIHRWERRSRPTRPSPPENWPTSSPAAFKPLTPPAARRDVHTKATVCVKAEFRVSDTVPASLAKGVFVPGKTYQAGIRFSNGSAEPGRSDDNEDG